MALEQDLLNNKSNLVSERSVFADAKSFEFMNIVGDYSSLSTLLSKELSIAPSDDSKNIFGTLTKYLIKLKAQNKFLFIFIDEFGKILEYAANNNPEKELYSLQTLAEFVNVSSRNVILITTLHQNFGAYAYKVTTKKRNAERYSDRIELQGFQSCFRLFVKPSQSPLKPNQDAATLLVRNHARNGDKRTRITKQGVKD